MQRSSNLFAGGIPLALAVAVFAACADSSPEPPLLTEVEPAASATLQTSEPPHYELARRVALSLRDPSTRAGLRAAMGTSPVKEGKLHLQTYLTGGGEGLLSGMTPADAVRGAELSALLARLGGLEVYFPIAEHRARWSGGTDLIVASQMEEDEVPYGVDLDGRPVTLSLASAPHRPTLAIVPTESFDGVGRALTRDLGGFTGSGPALAPDATTWTGLWINEVHVGHDYESWTRGSPEFEMHLEKASGGERSTITCADEDLSVEPYRWDMDDEDYTDPFLLAQESEIPLETKLVVHMWEDDDGRCVLKTLDGKDYVKLVTDYLRAISDIYEAIEYKRFLNGRFVLALRRAIIAGRALILGNDDFVGVAAGLSRIDETAKTFVLKGENSVNTGTIIVQLRSVTIE